jgi:hypothetical protein
MFQGFWPITAIKDKKMTKDCPQPVRVQYLLEVIVTLNMEAVFLIYSFKYRTHFPGFYSSDVYIVFLNAKLCLSEKNIYYDADIIINPGKLLQLLFTHF